MGARLSRVKWSSAKRCVQEQQLTLAQRHEPVRESIGVGQINVLAEELPASSAKPQVCGTRVVPMRAPKCFGSVWHCSMADMTFNCPRLTVTIGVASLGDTQRRLSAAFRGKKQGARFIRV